MEELPHLTPTALRQWLESNPELPDCGFNCTSPWNSPIARFLKLPMWLKDGRVWCEVDAGYSEHGREKVQYNLPDWAIRYELAAAKSRVKSIADAIACLNTI